MYNLIFGLKSSPIDMNADVDRLARRLAETHLPPRRETDDQRPKENNRVPAHDEDQNAWIHFPPETTLDEHLLILGGGEAVSAPHPSSYLYDEKENA
ncbi:hypothetical protein E8E11_002309 [Didymella keratinophila]|nr:hypothetical protein E8E11_002309 [Didymella keratinophila]